MRIIPYDYEPGGGYGLCQRCGVRFRHYELRKEWSGLVVCNEDWDPLPDTMTPPVVFVEGLPYPDASPDMPAVFVNTVSPEDL